MFSSKMFLPSEKLKDWIKVFWFLEGRGKGTDFHTRNILPDGCATICIIFNGQIDLTIYKNGIIKKGIYVIPPVIKAHSDFISNDISLVDIQLNPSVFYKLFNIPIINLEDKIYTLQDLSIDIEDSLIERLYSLKDNKVLLCSLLNKFCEDLFYKQSFKTDLVTENICQLYKTGDLDRFFKEQDLSARQLERKVKHYTGLTPKNISRMGRFYSVLDYMKYRQFNIEFSELAFKYNFSDQSHFIRDFKSFTNSTPKNFLQETKSFLQFDGICNLVDIKK